MKHGGMTENGHTERGIIAGMLDMDNVAVIGHSFGGATAGGLAAASHRYVCGVTLDPYWYAFDIRVFFCVLCSLLCVHILASCRCVYFACMLRPTMVLQLLTIPVCRAALKPEEPAFSRWQTASPLLVLFASFLDFLGSFRTGSKV